MKDLLTLDLVWKWARGLLARNYYAHVHIVEIGEESVSSKDVERCKGKAQLYAYLCEARENVHLDKS